MLGTYYDGLPMPTVVHYCQNFRAGELGFQKRRVPHNIFSCESPLLVDTPRDLAQAKYKIKSGKVMHEKKSNVCLQFCIIYELCELLDIGSIEV